MGFDNNSKLHLFTNVLLHMYMFTVVRSILILVVGMPFYL